MARLPRCLTTAAPTSPSDWPGRIVDFIEDAEFERLVAADTAPERVFVEERDMGNHYQHAAAQAVGGVDKFAQDFVGVEQRGGGVMVQLVTQLLPIASRAISISTTVPGYPAIRTHLNSEFDKMARIGARDAVEDAIVLDRADVAIAPGQPID